MALKPCKECSKEVSTKAKTCPHCGVKNPCVTTKDILIGMIGIVVIVLVAISFLSSDSDEDSQKDLQIAEEKPVIQTNQVVQESEAPNNKKPTIVRLTSDDVDVWPLTVDEIRAVCFYMPRAVFRIGGILDDYYALNNAPMPNLDDLGLPRPIQLTPDLDIWAADPENPGARINVMDLANKIDEVCGKE